MSALVKPSDHALMIDVQEEAARHGLILITDGKEMAYTLPHYIPEGWTRFVMVQKNSRRISRREIVCAG